MAHTLLRGLYFNIWLVIALATSSLANPIAGYATTYEVLTEGAGDAVSKGSQVTVHATGIVEESGYQFWSTKDAGQQPFSYQAGVGKVITGWDQGCLGMKIGEVRKLRIPAHEGYGANGFPAWKIPKQATLLFEIEVLKIDGKSKVEL
jgi:FKBP-type peptidyl-prolyl cis-trans isomerase